MASPLFSSHIKLNEVMEISDRITVMRQGCFIGTVDKQDTSPSDLARMMIGREVFLDIKKEKADIGDVVLEVKDLWTSGEKRDIQDTRCLYGSQGRGNRGYCRY